MIPVHELGEHTRDDRSVVAVASWHLDDDEQVAYDRIDVRADDAVSLLQGSMCGIAVTREEASEKVVGALVHNWEANGWIVGVFPVDNGWRVIFAKPRGSLIAPQVITESLASREDPPAADEIVYERDGLRSPETSCPLLVRMPTRGRPEQALWVLRSYRQMAETNVHIEVVIDEDDTSMNNARVLQALCDLDCTITIGRHRSKIEAVNAGRVWDWAILALASDDMQPVVQGYDRRIIEEMDRHFPLRDGALNFNDGYNKDHVRPGRPILNTLPIIGRHLYEQFGYVYFPGYGSLYCDDEFTEIMTSMRRMVLIDDVIIEHRHHAAGKAPHDAVYQFNDDKWGAHDRNLFEDRQACGFEDKPPLLSILICTVPSRAAMLRRLVDWLRWQMRWYPRMVELRVDDRVGITVGEKRQALLERAIGRYVAFIDDDDWVTHDYIARIIHAFDHDGAAYDWPDCLSLVGEMTTNGANVERFEHSIKFKGWYTENGVHFRTPNHLSVVRRDLALRVGFIAQNVGEDHDYSERLRPLLTVEASTGAAPLYYYFYRPAQSVQAAR